jgi:hypothetical protein
MDGKKVEHYNTTNYAVHVLGVGPIWGDATLQQTMSDFTKEAQTGGHSAVRVVQSDKTTLWWILPPISVLQYRSWNGSLPRWLVSADLAPNLKPVQRGGIIPEGERFDRIWAEDWEFGWRDTHLTNMGELTRGGQEDGKGSKTRRMDD